MRIPTACLAALLALVILAPAATGQGRQSDRPTVSTKVPPQPKGIQIDPDNDIILITIREQVKPTEKQMKQIVRLYTELRETQLEMTRETVRELRRLQKAEERDIRLGDEEETEQEKRTRHAAVRTAYTKRLAAKMKPLNEKFLADCRALLDESQHEAWDKCAEELDLLRGGTRSTRKELQWLEPQRGPAVGDEAPDFELEDLEGNAVSLRDLRGKPVVLRFGSYTSRTFRHKASEFEQLKREYGDDVHWPIVYTLEQYASDSDWTSFRNKQEGIEIPQHKTYEERVECAAMAREKLNLTGLLLVDDFDNRVARLYSGHPNRAYVIDGEGIIVSKQVWSKVGETKAALDELLGLAETEEPITPGTAPGGAPRQKSSASSSSSSGGG
ncbi:MAG: deiodinase-like protein [Planctomycetota bacterium]|nr:deiodinase-like protein [Planctomycetota bacterium]